MACKKKTKPGKRQMAYVYWVHKVSDTMIGVEGYVGVTTRKQVETRWKEHVRASEKEGSCSKYLMNVIRKYGEELVYDCIFTGDVDDCYELEEFYRPTGGIGWNNAAGGCVSSKGYTHTDTAKAKISASKKGVAKSSEHKEKLRLANRGTRMGCKNSAAISVTCVETGMVFSTIKEASKWAGMKSQAGITYVCEGKQKMFGGYTWKYTSGGK